MGSKGYGLATRRMHQLLGNVVCFKQKKTTGASSGYGTTTALNSLLASSSTSCTTDPASSCSRCPTSSSIAASHPGDGTVSELESAPEEDTPSSLGCSSSVIMAVRFGAVREKQTDRITIMEVKLAVMKTWRNQSRKRPTVRKKFVKLPQMSPESLLSPPVANCVTLTKSGTFIVSKHRYI